MSFFSLSNNNLGEAEAETLITVIRDNHSIVTLILDDNAFADRGTKHIGTMLTRAKQLEQLRYLVIYLAIIFLIIIFARLFVFVISLQNNGIGFSGTRDIALALEQNTKLKFLGYEILRYL